MHIPISIIRDVGRATGLRHNTKDISTKVATWWGMIALLSKINAVTVQEFQSIALIFQFDNDAGLEEIVLVRVLLQY
jgi:hypothetical protein